MSPALAITGAAHLVLLAVLLLASPFDQREVLGVPVWIKPMKFALSIAVYVFTVAWLLRYVPEPRWARSLVAVGTSICMAVEIVCIVLQAARGTTSHFNFATALDAAVFATMGIAITANSLLLVLLFLLFLPSRALPSAALWGVRFGLLIALAASGEGAFMAAHGAHTMGAPDGGPGLPVANRSTRHGDLRVAHFLGLHALQILPLLGFLIHRVRPLWQSSVHTAAITAAALCYLMLTAWEFHRALNGVPFLQ